MSKTTYKCKHEKVELAESKLSKKKFLKVAKDFVKEKLTLKKDETLFVVKATIDEENQVVSHGAYYGSESSPLSVLVNSKDNSEEVFLAEALDGEAVVELLKRSKKSEVTENIYIFKVVFKEFKLISVESFFVNPLKLTLTMFEYSDPEERQATMLHELGELEYVQNLSFYAPDILI